MIVDKLVSFVRDYYATDKFIPLHAPVFIGNEKKLLNEVIDSTFVSSVGAFVDLFEKNIAKYTESPAAVATMNGTAALHTALLLCGVKQGDLVITQPLTFIATCNAISYCGAEPVFVDVERGTLGMSPSALNQWLEENALISDSGECISRIDNRVIRACVPMHTFGHPADLDGLMAVCGRWRLPLIEDAAESLGSFYKGRHTGTFGLVGTLSFNGNKIITTGGGGMLLTTVALGVRAKHLTTTAKIPHPFDFFHDEVGYNYRLPNINAALGCAQLEQIDRFISNKRFLAKCYSELFKGTDLDFVLEPPDCQSNYWLNAAICRDRAHRDYLLRETNSKGVMTRPIWTLMNRLPMFSNARVGNLEVSEWLEDRVVNLPSSVFTGNFA